MSDQNPPAQYPEPTVQQLCRAGLRDVISAGGKDAQAAKDELAQRGN